MVMPTYKVTSAITMNVTAANKEHVGYIVGLWKSQKPYIQQLSITACEETSMHDYCADNCLDDPFQDSEDSLGTDSGIYTCSDCDATFTRKLNQCIRCDGWNVS
jgi:hypothetical protein